ncbi:hypothetical protein ACFYST_08075 [Kitasatospora sp. NPDC004614]|uniref:hypothetical protein n=1 Tax=unclassified Kitasatospora TaxID=2633591 RepID=UPI0036A65C57
MTDTTVRALIAFLPLLLAGWAAWALSADHDRPKGRHRAGDRPLKPFLIELRGQRLDSWAQIEQTGTPSSTQTNPRRVTASHPRQQVTERVRALEARAADRDATIELRLLPNATIEVVPRWVRRFEQQQQAARRAALEAAAAGLPDTGYTYPGAHALAS